MIELIPGLPDHILGFRARGKVTGEDYQSVLVPALEKALADRPKVRMLYHLGDDCEGFDAGALLDDAKVGMKHLAAFERIAVVTDLEWIQRTIKMFGFALPGKIKMFSGEQLTEARTWICE